MEGFEGLIYQRYAFCTRVRAYRAWGLGFGVFRKESRYYGEEKGIEQRMENEVDTLGPC